jgi:hypothetical protein
MGILPKQYGAMPVGERSGRWDARATRIGAGPARLARAHRPRGRLGSRVSVQEECESFESVTRGHLSGSNHV